MDWFDQYLDGLSDCTNVVYPPDSHTWRPVRPTKQQQSLIQDSLIGDMVRMRLIQEARQAEIDAGMGGGYDAGSAAKEGPVTPPAPTPSGIPYSTSQVTLVGFNETNLGIDHTNNPITLTKLTALGYPYEWGNMGNLGYDVFLYRQNPNSYPNGTWGILLQQFGEEGFGFRTAASNPSTSTTEIPTTGWVLEAGVTGAITITAA
ncbi:MAG: hypothetical protein EBU90_27560 [Proteobacteria bacterium]|nr:hypothetical protein [Pseudomonadota bacterium]NBP15513.1 hypothetical protein [bacterium]